MNRVVPFTKFRVIFPIISLCVIVIGLAATVLLGGFNLGIDYQAGLSQRFQIEGEPVNVEEIREILNKYSGAQIQRIGDEEQNEFAVRVKVDEEAGEVAEKISGDILTILKAKYGENSVIDREYISVDAKFSESLTGKSIFVILLAVILILIYIWFRFKLAYAVSAMAAIVHDVLILVGVLGVLQIEISTAIIAAILTIIGYSLNDTIVIFDRVRENHQILRDETNTRIVDISITQSLGRTIITSVTTMFSVVALFIFAKGSIRDFALSFIIGIFVGTYSSIFIASPVLLLWQRLTGQGKTSLPPGKAKKPSAPPNTAAAPAGNAGSAEGEETGEEAKPVLQQRTRKKQSRKKRKQN